MNPADFKVAGADELAPVLRRWASVPWKWDASFVERLFEDLQWIAASKSGRNILANTGLPIARTAIAELGHDGNLESVTIFGTTVIAPAYWSDDKVKEILRDAFADIFDAVVGVLGPPTKTMPGDEPESRWQLDGGTLSVVATSASINLSVLSPAEIEQRDRDAALVFPDEGSIDD